MKKNKIIILTSIILILTVITITCILLLNSNKETYILCEASEEKDGITTIVTSKYNYNKEKTIIESIDYSISLSGKMDENQLASSKELFQNTICKKDNQPDNIQCNIEVEENKITVKTHEEIKNNESSLLGLKNLDKLTYEHFKNNQDSNAKCTSK